MTSTPPRHLIGSGSGAHRVCYSELVLWQPLLRQLASLPAGSRVLDAGCGNGFFTTRLREKGFDAVGLDWDESGIIHARQLCPDARFEVASVCDNIDALFRRQFDAVDSLEVIEHACDPRSFITTVHECFVPMGCSDFGRFIMDT
jgi:2-polyprenyl-3-methyl-5-hydroxy-6-metoxy-1,4-benzoquinol methylase